MTYVESIVLATNIVNALYDEGMAKSTWRDNHEAAYQELAKYRLDMVNQVASVIRNSFYKGSPT